MTTSTNIMQNLFDPSNYFDFWNTIFTAQTTQSQWELDNVDVPLPKEYQKYESTCGLKRFDKVENSKSIPFFIIAPYSAHDSTVAQNYINMLKKNFPNNEIYSTDWKSVSWERRNDGIDELAHMMVGCIKAIGRKVHIVGLCMGGPLATIIAARYPQLIASLHVDAAPINPTEEDEEYLNSDYCKNKDWKKKKAVDRKNLVKLATEMLPESYYQMVVNMFGGYYSGHYQLFNFKMMNWFDRFYGDFVKLFMSIMMGGKEKEKAIKGYLKLHVWYSTVVDMPGKWFVEWVTYIFIQDLLAQNKLVVHGEIVNLKNIKCPIVSTAGQDDDITAMAMCHAIIIKKLTSAKHTLAQSILNVGHLGCFVSSKAYEALLNASKFVEEHTCNDLFNIILLKMDFENIPLP